MVVGRGAGEVSARGSVWVDMAWMSINAGDDKGYFAASRLMV